MGDLAERMHAGIGAPGAQHLHGLATKCLRGRHHGALHREAALLHLPADEGRAVILDDELVAWHERLQPSRMPEA